MHVDIRSRGFDLTPALRAHTERRLAFALSRFAPQLTNLVVRMDDLNGPKGGIDKRCRMEARLLGHPALVVEATGSDLYVAIDAAADRLGRSVSRALERSQDRATDRALAQ